jgi:hypothetical protein
MLLPCDVPDLQLDDGTLVHFHHTGAELHSYGYLIIGFEGAS